MVGRGVWWGGRSLGWGWGVRLEGEWMGERGLTAEVAGGVDVVPEELLEVLDFWDWG